MKEDRYSAEVDPYRINRNRITGKESDDQNCKEIGLLLFGVFCFGLMIGAFISWLLVLIVNTSILN